MLTENEFDGDHWLPLKEVCRKVGGSAATIYRLMARDPTFPRPAKLGVVNRWSARELAGWMESRLAVQRGPLVAASGEPEAPPSPVSSPRPPRSAGAATRQPLTVKEIEAAISDPATDHRRSIPPPVAAGAVEPPPIAPPHVAPRARGPHRVVKSRTQALTVKEIDAAQPDPAKDHRLSDTQNLYLIVRQNGSKLWRWDYAFDGRRNTLSFGVYPIVTLARAREKKRAAQVLMDRGIDPGAERRDKRQAKRAPAETFAALAEAWVTQKARTKKPRTILKLRSILNNHLLPSLGAQRISALTEPDIMAALRPLDEKGLAETAHRALSITSEIFTYARAHGATTRDITEHLSRGLTPVQTTNYPALTAPIDIGRLMRSIAACTGSPILCAALQFAPLVFVRAGELRGARWSEFDFEAGEWRIPAARMSHTFTNGTHHIIPLARQALALLTALRPLTGGGPYVFPSLRHHSRPLSDMALTAALRRLGYGPDEQSVHGFRTIASTRLREIGFPDPLVELQLAHRIKNPVEAAYNKATMLQRRAEMMQAYADHLDDLRARADREDAARRAG